MTEPVEPAGLKARLRNVAVPYLPPRSRRRAAARFAREAYRVAGQSATTLRRRAEENFAAADVAPPYSVWLADHRRHGQSDTMQRAALRSTNPVSVDLHIVDGGPAVDLGVDLGAQYWPRVATFATPPLDATAEDDRTHAVVFCSADDRFEPDFAFRVADAFWENPNLDVVFWDADELGSLGSPHNPLFTTEWAPETMLSANPIGRSFAIRRSALRAVGGLNAALGDDGYWDLLLRVVSDRGAARRIPRLLQHLSRRPEPVGRHGERVVAEELARRGWPANPRRTAHAIWLDWDLPEWPTVSIVVPSRFNRPLLERLMPSLEATDYPSFDVTVTDNSVPTAEADEFYGRWAPGGVSLKVVRTDPDAEFNYSRVNNQAVAATAGDIVLLLNDDTDTEDPDWLRQMVGWAAQEEIGTVGVQLWDDDDRIQHGGVVMGLMGLAEHLFGGMAPHSPSLLGHTDWVRNSMAVTAACVAIRRELWDQIGGFDERFILCGSDVVLGLDAHLRGYRNVCTPASVVRHLESATRGEFNAVGDMYTSYWRYQRWISGGDPYFSPSLSMMRHQPTLALAVSPKPLDLLGPALGRSFGVFAQSMSQQENRHLAAMCDVSEADVQRVAERHRSAAGHRDVRSVTWFLPEFDSPFYGGINSALRIADNLRSAHDVENRFVFVAGANEAWFRSALRASFPGLADAPMAFTDGFTHNSTMPVADIIGHSDAAVATIWHTAYTVATYEGADRSFYLIQDFEPGFYPNGTLFALAEESYKLGLYGLCNSPTMGSIYAERYGGVGHTFVPAVDRTVFHPPAIERDPEGPLRIFLYARPGHWRNCWELAQAAIARVKERYGDRVHFVSAGSWARPNDVDLGIEQLGLLEYASTGDLYRTCDAGIALTVSEHPSYLPLELGACGVPVVAFDLPAGYWVLKDGVNSLLARRTISSLAEKIEALVVDAELRRRLSRGAVDHIDTHHNAWDEALAGIYPFMCNPDG